MVAHLGRVRNDVHAPRPRFEDVRYRNIHGDSNSTSGQNIMQSKFFNAATLR